MNPSELEALVKQGLERFYERRIANLSRLQLFDVLKRKNPYLLRAVGISSASELVQDLLKQHILASDETIFGDAFVEPIALAVSGGKKSSAEGVDIEVEDEAAYKAISVKSGPNIFNSSQVRKMNEQFDSLRRRLDQYLRQVRKHFVPILGAAYGKKDLPPNRSRFYRHIAGQAFWEDLTGDPDFYLKLIRLMKDYPEEHRKRFELELNKATNRFVRDLLNEFAETDGTLNWEKLVEYNSGKHQRKRTHGGHAE
ncbi:MAG: PmeII family type II restriction endonuclease [Armatimonadota bacterium]